MSYPVKRELIKENLFEAVNGEWLAQAVIPDDKSSVGGFQDLADEVEAKLMADLEQMGQDLSDLTEMQQEMVKFHQLALDVEAREKLGYAPVKPYIEQALALQSVDEFTDLVIAASKQAAVFPVKVGVGIDMADSTHHLVYVSGGSLILPDKTYYDPAHEKGQALLKCYREVATELFDLAGFAKDEAARLIELGMEYDAMMAPYTLTSEEAADYTRFYQPHTFEQVQAYSDAIDFERVLTHLFGEVPTKINVPLPEFCQGLNTLLQPQYLEHLKAWMVLIWVVTSAGYVSETARAIKHRYNQELTGNPAMRSAEKTAYSLVNHYYEQVIGNYYAQRYFGETAKADVRAMVEAMIRIYQQRLATKEWLSQSTREAAIRKLDKMDILVGYPDAIPAFYQQLKVLPEDTFYSAAQRFDELAALDNLAKWNQKVDRQEWHMGANLVNAYFDPYNNLICFPAAILQAPFYSLEQSRSANYGGIGAVIAHEISHAFDNNGSKFDENGNLNNWWTEEDYAQFDALAKRMIERWDGIPFADGKINGTLTVSENIADAGGLSCALEATELLADADLEAFFLNWARIWCRKARPDYVNLLLAVDVHSPGELRANLAPQNLAQFYTTFDIQAGDAMYLEPEKRVNIW